MTKAEYLADNCDGKLCVFRLVNGVSLRGVISNFFPGEDDVYYYVSEGNLNTFNSLMKKDKFAEMKFFCSPISLSVIMSAALI